MDMVEKVVREACARSPDGKISPEDFSSHASRSMRYGTFSPMEVSIIFHYAGKGTGTRLGLKDFAQLLDPKWGPPKAAKKVESPSGSVLYEVGKVRPCLLEITERQLMELYLYSHLTTLPWEEWLELVSFAY